MHTDHEVQEAEPIYVADLKQQKQACLQQIRREQKPQRIQSAVAH